MNWLPEDADDRNAIPLADGLIDYFPNALCEVAKISAAGNSQHNGDAPLHWARGKSTDHRNKIARHLIDTGGKDENGMRHSAYLAWRALALLQEELERDTGVPLPRNARIEPPEPQRSHNPALDPDIEDLMPEGAPPSAYAE